MAFHEPEASGQDYRPVVLLTGATGYVGGRLLPLLEQHPVVVRTLARNPGKLQHCKPSTQIVRGDLLDLRSLDEAMRGVHTAYYLVHLMSGTTDFEQQDRQAAVNFAGSAKAGGEFGGSFISVGWAMMPMPTFRHTCVAAMKSDESCGIRASRPSSSEPR